jgi:hypothetical protein
MNGVIKVNQLRFDTIIDRKFPFKEAGQAFEYLWSAIHVGKISAIHVGKIAIELSEDGWIHKSGWSYVFCLLGQRSRFSLGYSKSL